MMSSFIKIHLGDCAARIRLMFCAAAVFFGSTLIAQQYETVEDLSKDFIRALNKGKTSEFRKLYTSDSVISANFSEVLGFDMERALLRDFTRIVEVGREKGIDWSRIKFVKSEYITKSDGPFLIAHPTVIIFQHRLFRYAVNMNCTKIGNSWSFVPIERTGPVIYMKKL